MKLTVQAGLANGAVAPTSLERVIVDTTVQEKAVAFQTDSRLYNRSRERLVKLAAAWGIPLRQSYRRLRRLDLLKIGRYFHAHQARKACREVRRLKTYLGRVYRDIVRKIEDQQALRPVSLPEFALAQRLLTQQKQDKNKLFSLHAP